MSDFAAAMRAAMSDAQLDEALHALKRVADALGIFPLTWRAESITEVGDMLVAEIEHRKSNPRTERTDPDG